MFKQLIEKTKEEAAAEKQLASILNFPLNTVGCYTQQEWHKTAKLWLLISKGVFVADAKSVDIRRLRQSGTRLECEAIIRRYGFTLDGSAEAWGVDL
jgi:hypothetical protein